jgi:hypothetical protein
LPPGAAQTDYLQALEAEATKISAPSPAVNAGQQADSPVAPADSAPGRDQFETVLREQYRGTYVFYQELPENAREEFLGEFRRGVPLAELREKIVDRYLQR